MNARHSPFREAAFRRYVQTRDESVLPRLVSPHTFLCLWLLLGLCAAGGVTMAFATVPVYATGPGVIVDPTVFGHPADEGMLAAVFLPVAEQSRIRADQPISLEAEPSGERISGEIVAVEPEPVSPATVYHRFGLDPSAVPVVSQPAVVAIARVPGTSTTVQSSTYLGSVYRAHVVVGQRSIISTATQVEMPTGAW